MVFFNGRWITLHDGQKNSIADVIRALQFQHNRVLVSIWLSGLQQYIYFVCFTIDHVCIVRCGDEFVVRTGIIAVSRGSNLLINMMYQLLFSDNENSTIT